MKQLLTVHVCNQVEINYSNEVISHLLYLKGNYVSFVTLMIFLRLTVQEFIKGAGNSHYLLFIPS